MRVWFRLLLLSIAWLVVYGLQIWLLVSLGYAEPIFKRGEIITASRWNEMVVKAQCPQAQGVPTESLIPLVYRVASCLAAQANQEELREFFEMAATWGLY